MSPWRSCRRQAGCGSRMASWANSLYYWAGPITAAGQTVYITSSLVQISARCNCREIRETINKKCRFILVLKQLGGSDHNQTLVIFQGEYEPVWLKSCFIWPQKLWIFYRVQKGVGQFRPYSKLVKVNFTSSTPKF